MRYFIELNIDQRPPKRDWIGEGAYLHMIRLGWFGDGRAVLLDQSE